MCRLRFGTQPARRSTCRYQQSTIERQMESYSYLMSQNQDHLQTLKPSGWMQWRNLKGSLATLSYRTLSVNKTSLQRKACTRYLMHQSLYTHTFKNQLADLVTTVHIDGSTCTQCVLFPCSGCPEAVKLLVGNKCDLPAEVDLQQAKVHNLTLCPWCYWT